MPPQCPEVCVLETRIQTIINILKQFNYETKFGFEVTNAKPTGIVLKALKACYGSPAKENTKIARFTANADGQGSVDVKQQYKDCTFTSGKRTFNIRLYTKAILSVTTAENVEPKGHSGGSAQ